MIDQATLQYTFTERAQAAGAKVHAVSTDPDDAEGLVDLCGDDILLTTGFSRADSIAEVVQYIAEHPRASDEKLLAAGTRASRMCAGVAETGSIASSNSHDLRTGESVHKQTHRPIGCQ